MKNIFLALFCIFSFSTFAQEREITFMVGAVKRRAILVHEQTGKRFWPAVIVLHGGNGSAEVSEAGADLMMSRREKILPLSMLRERLGALEFMPGIQAIFFANKLEMPMILGI